MRRLVTLAAVAALCVPMLAFAASGDPTPDQVRVELGYLHIVPRQTDRAIVQNAGSMEPTLRCAKPGTGCTAQIADHVFVRVTPPASLKRGAIVVLSTPQLAKVRCGAGSTLVQRVVGLPGERIEERSGRVFVNGKALGEPYVLSANRDDRTFAPVHVPPRSFFVMGDNRSATCDSRVWGTVPFAKVLGRAIAIYWPSSRVRHL